MVDYAAARERMVDSQLRPADVTSYPLLAAMLEEPREAYLPSELRPLAYADIDLAVPGSLPGRRALLAAVTFARMVQAAEIGRNDVVLDVGSLTGYSTAVLSRLAGTVVALEEDPAFVADASGRLAELGHDNIAVVQGPLVAGCPDEAPFDVVIVNGAVELEPSALLRQLKDGGRLAVVEGVGKAGRAVLYRRVGDDFGRTSITNAAAPLLPGFEKPKVFQF